MVEGSRGTSRTSRTQGSLKSPGTRGTLNSLGPQDPRTLVSSLFVRTSEQEHLEPFKLKYKQNTSLNYIIEQSQIIVENSVYLSVVFLFIELLTITAIVRKNTFLKNQISVLILYFFQPII